jgi:cell wall assembly regulator SMI1
LDLPNRRLTNGVRGPWKALAARSPKEGSKKPAAPKSAPKPAAPKPAAPKAAKPAPAAPPPPPFPRRRRNKPEPLPHRPERLALRQMGRGRKPPNLPETPLLPPAPPSAPDYQGAAPTMHYGEAPVPPKKKSKKGAAPRSTAAKAAEAARAAVWAVSSEKTTAQIEAAENAFEEALSEHKAKEEKVDVPTETAPETSTQHTVTARRTSIKDRWTFFREEVAREDDPSDPHYAWRQEAQRPRHELFLPAPEEGIKAVETELKVKFPPSYREFNLNWCGGRLFTQEFREIRLVGALEIQRELKDRLCERMHAPWLPMADLGDGDYLAFDTSKPNAKGEYAVYWWYGGQPKKKVAASFQDWLEQLVASGGEAFWWEEA